MNSDVCVNFVQTKGVYEKVGEATETALTVLVEKMNVTGIDKSRYNKKELGTVVNQSIQAMYKKEFTLEFSRDRKSMSCYCVPTKLSNVGSGPKMFLKVSASCFDRLDSVRTVYASGEVFLTIVFISMC